MGTLLESYSAGRLDIRNRVVQSATVTNLGRNDAISDVQVSFYAARAAGGVGLVVTEGLAVHTSSIPTHTVPLAYEERMVPDFARLAGAVNEQGARILGQLWHAGRQALWNPMQLPWSASSERDPYSGSTPHAVTASEIDELIEAFARSASNLRHAGFDGVELHGAHGYLLTQFMSGWSNRRDDDYGGSAANRARLVVRIIERVRETCGDGFVVGLKISADEGVPGGIDLDGARELVAHMVETAAPDYVAVSQGNFSPSLEWHTPDMRFDDGHFRHLWRGVREVSGDVPVMAVGKVPDLAFAQSLIDEGDADLVAMTRALLAEPDLVNKHVAGKEARPCVYCNLCWHQIHTLRPVGCFYAPDAPESPVAQPALRARGGASQDVRVVGAGLAGLEFARTAALDGHTVHLYEARSHTGGGLVSESAVPGRESMAAAAEWLEREVRELDVAVKLACNVDADSIDSWPEEAVVVQATGARTVVDGLPGLANAMSLDDAIAGRAELVGPLALVDELDDEPVYAAAEALARQGLEVLLVTRRPALGRHVPWVNLLGIFRRLDEAGVDVQTSALLQRVEAGELVMSRSFSQREFARPAVATVVRCGPLQPDEPLEVRGRKLLRIGDALSPRGLQAVALEAHRVARELHDD
ncbi:MAG: NAD(P)-binding protein [Gaiellaceae bacterium]